MKRPFSSASDEASSDSSYYTYYTTDDSADDSSASLSSDSKPIVMSASASNPQRMFSMHKKPKLQDDAAAIRQYIIEHGFGPKTPALTRRLAPEIFRQHYYDKQELMEFCRSQGISTSGLKEDLNGRIELYLRTGKVTVVQAEKRSTVADSVSGLSLTKVVVNYKSDPATRRFFERHIPAFTGFSALVQKQIKARLSNNERFTYGDVIAMHKAFLSNKRSAEAAGEAGKVAHDSCQFNQFYIDYSHDSNPKLHTAKEAWMLVRDSAGDKTFQRYLNKIEEIRGILRSQNSAEVAREAAAVQP